MFISSFVEDKYEQYKSSYEMLIDLIVNSVFQTFVSKYGKIEDEMTH